MEAKEYKIESFEDLCNLVNSDNLEILSEDLKTWLISYHLAIEGVRKLNSEALKGLKNTEIAKGSFIWIDDNKNDLKGVVIEQGEKSERVDFNQ